MENDFTMDFSQYFNIGSPFGGLAPQGDGMLTSVVNDSIMVIWQVQDMIDGMSARTLSEFIDAFRDGVTEYSLVQIDDPGKPFGAIFLVMREPVGTVFVAPYLSMDMPDNRCKMQVRDLLNFCDAIEPSLILHLVDGAKLAASMAFTLNKEIARALQVDIFPGQCKAAGIKDSEAALMLNTIARTARQSIGTQCDNVGNNPESCDAVKVISAPKPLSLILGPQFARRRYEQDARMSKTLH
jgi:hypothetical protein